MINHLQNKALLIIALLVLSSASCDRDKFRFPYVPVQLELGLISDLGNLGVYESRIIPNQGLQGLVVWRNDVDEYHVYDRACTFEEDFSCAVVEDTTFSGVYKCPCCGSRYLLFQNGDPLDGPASWPLVEYNSYINGGFLVIRN